MHFTGVVAACLVLVFLLSACHQELTIEQRVIAAIRDMETRIEEGERRPFMAHVAEEFQGQNGAMSREQLNALILYQLHRNQRVQAQLLPIYVIAKTPETAEAQFSAVVTGGPGILPDRGQVFEFVTQWHKQDEEWMLISAVWTPNVLDY